MQLTKEILEKIHAVDQELLDEFVRVCEENNLKYYLDGGTLLGAIRHKGPIPWDDDLDVIMPREDYEKFREIMLAEPESGGGLYHIHCNENDPNFPNRFVKLLKRNTVFTNQVRIDRRVKYLEVWIDIFPLDDAPDNIDWKWRVYCWFMRKVTNACYLKPRVRDSLSFKQKAERVILAPFSLKKILLFDRKLMRRYEKKSGCNHYVRWAGSVDYAKTAMPKAWFEPSVKVLYGGKYYSAPKEWDKVLTCLYGDYMTPPPIEKQVGHEVLDVRI